MGDFILYKSLSFPRRRESSLPFRAEGMDSRLRGNDRGGCGLGNNKTSRAGGFMSAEFLARGVGDECEISCSFYCSGKCALVACAKS